MQHISNQKSCLRIFYVGLIALATLCIIATVARAENKKPRAVIDGDVNVQVGDTVYLNGDLSSDPDGDTLRYTWSITSWPEGGQAFEGRDRRFQFDAPVAGKYEVRLVVNDGVEDSDPYTMTVTVTEK
jgi:hypothetical protein